MCCGMFFVRFDDVVQQSSFSQCSLHLCVPHVCGGHLGSRSFLFVERCLVSFSTVAIRGNPWHSRVHKGR